MLFEKLIERIVALGKVENVSKAEQGSLSREILIYMLIGFKDLVDGEEVFCEPSYDVRVVNKLLSILSPANRRVSVLFYSALLPWKYDKETGQFEGKRHKKQVEPKTDEVKVLLADAEWDIWAWIEANVRMEKKEPDYLKKFESDLKKGLEAGIEPAMFLHVLSKCLDVTVENENAVEIDEALAVEIANAA